MTGTSILVRDDPSGEPSAPAGRRWRRVAIGLAVLLVWLVVGGLGGSYQGKLGSVQKNDESQNLPPSAESTLVSNETEKFSDNSTIPGFVVFTRESGLTAADTTFIAAVQGELATLDGVAADQVAAPVVSSDRSAASISVPLLAKVNGVGVNGQVLSDAEKAVISTSKDGAPSGLLVYSAGPGGLLVAFVDAFAGIDGKLIGIAGVVVIVLLLLVYRSPVLWFFPLFSAGLALSASALAVYFLAKHEVITLNGQSQGILSVLVIGAGTDYALLLISRYREELHQYASRSEAMWKAWKGAAPAIIASAATVILGLLCLLFATLNSDRGLGPVCAIGIACTVLVMLTFLPVLLVVAGRWIFWPRRPTADGASEMDTHRVWSRLSELVGRRARTGALITGIFLIVCIALIGNLKIGTLSNTQQFTNTPEAVTGQKIYNAKFAQGAGAPAVITLAANRLDQVVTTVKATPGFSQEPGALCLQPDYAAVAAAVRAGHRSALTPGEDGCLPPRFTVQPIGGRTVLQAQLVSAYDSAAAARAIVALRDRVHGVQGAGAKVGGSTAAALDVNDASVHDRNTIIPIVLAVILVVLAILLRALVAPLLLIATVVLSFFATLGVSGFVFEHILHFPKAPALFVLYSFIFLVALGIDYNIFLMTRIREETMKIGTRRGILRGLAVTGGVITSAGLVLASTFAVLGVLPLVVLAEVGFAVAFGVLLDTFLVRSVLVPALSYEIGKKVWWPSKLASTAD